ncbi:conserved hypothetical protein [Magnetococcus marinus MC-1]|uniref:Uncharacterized protein n=1 Tax=Magnetococcus marinus (strain ATCC BAA-1437 / JCM 17883 / MC-1) TaxID=156889 RepID=A0L8A9_MAGMM|nr:hypothetical protein [Magnetococcus marinus]ABK44202.1 conserved hypothetical protein [Magnetococcus marinus MC-1]
MGIFRTLPLHLFMMAIYFGVVHFGYGGHADEAMVALVKSFQLLSGASISLTNGDIFIMVAIVMLFIEMVKSTSSSMSSVIDHMVSMLSFVAHLGLFLMIPMAGHPVFLILTLIAFVDVVGGFTITIVSARRDVAMG